MNRIFRQLAQLPDSSRTLPLLLLFSATLTGALLIFRMNADLNYDGEIYIAAAMKFAEGEYREALAIYPMPTYPALIALINNIFQNWILAGRLISLLSMTLAVIPLYKLTMELFNSRAAFWCGVAYILLQETLPLSNSVLREPVFILPFTWAVYFAQKALDSKEIKDLIYSVLLVLVSTLFRVEGLVLFPACFCVFAGLTVFNIKDCRHFIKIAVVWVVIGALVFAGISIAVKVSAVENLNNYNLWVAYFDGFWEHHFLENHSRIANQLLHINDTSITWGVGHNVAETARTLLPLIYFIGLFQVFSTTISAFNLIPLMWGFIRTEYDQRHILVLAIVAGFFVLAFGFFIRTGHMLTRYLIIPGMLLCPWIGFGIERILSLVQRIQYKRLAVSCVMLIVFLAPLIGLGKWFRYSDDLASRAGTWITKQKKLESLKILFNDQIVKFYADQESKNHKDRSTLLYVDSRDKDFLKLISHAQDNNVEAIVIKYRRDGNNKVDRFPGFKEIEEFNYKNKVIKVYILSTIIHNRLSNPEAN